MKMSFDSTKNCATSSSFLLLHQGMGRGDLPRMTALTAGISTSSRSKAATHGLGICESILFVSSLFFFSRLGHGSTDLLDVLLIGKFLGGRYMKAC